MTPTPVEHTVLDVERHDACSPAATAPFGPAPRHRTIDGKRQLFGQITHPLDPISRHLSSSRDRGPTRECHRRDASAVGLMFAARECKEQWSRDASHR